MDIAVAGCGLMGSGIARVLSAAGHAVTVFDADEERAARSAEEAGATATATLEAAVRDAVVVFEAIAEDEAAKHDLFHRIAAAAPRAIIASNTSSIPPSVLAEALSDPARFLVAHFFNPATIVPLVEIVPVAQTSAATIATVRDLLAGAGKEPVVLQRETPGFVANRLQAALLREAFALERDGVAGFADIDRIVRAGLGSRWAAAGPFGVVDLGGLDIWRAVTARLFPVLAVDETPPAALRERVDTGRLGAKTAAGFFDHDPGEDQAVRDRIAEHFRLEYPEPTS
ncbi:MAG TPA: 3-hydroxyacyl-CoA dehydrogenase family protein [Pseudolysinimonas sp.]|nr:3-hydroxyacyl-CoA dehydrogenase family protein [Pseudolysinimonas sp.]